VQNGIGCGAKGRKGDLKRNPCVGETDEAGVYVIQHVAGMLVQYLFESIPRKIDLEAFHGVVVRPVS